MHQQNDFGTGAVPAFLNKLWTLVEDPSTNDLIYWDANGLSFHVVDQARFAKEVLPLFFKHSNIASFIRQLNMYGFRKIMTLDQGGLKTEKDSMQFQHPYFIRGKDHLLELIKRKVSAHPKQEDFKVRTEDVSKVLVDVNQMKGKQDHINSRLEKLKRENEALWAEISDLRQKHSKQQQIVNKLIQFLMTLVGSRGLSGMKRKMPLMINDSSHMSPPKAPKYTRQLSLGSGKTHQPDYIDVMVQSPEPKSDPMICKIEDITDDEKDPLRLHLPPELSDPELPFPLDLSSSIFLPATTISELKTDSKSNTQIADPKHMSSSNKGRSEMPYPQITSPPETSSASNNTPEKMLDRAYHQLHHYHNRDDYPPQQESAQSNLETLKESLTSAQGYPHSGLSLLNRLYTRRDEFSDQVDFMQSDIESLRDMLSGSPYFDPNTMAGIFTGEEGSSNMQDALHAHEGQASRHGPVGNEVVQYMPMDLPSLFELTSGSDVDPTLSTLNNIDASKETLDTPAGEHMMDPLSEYMISSNGETKGLSTVTPSDDLD